MIENGQCFCCRYQCIRDIIKFSKNCGVRSIWYTNLKSYSCITGVFALAIMIKFLLPAKFIDGILYWHIYK